MVNVTVVYSYLAFYNEMLYKKKHELIVSCNGATDVYNTYCNANSS